MKNIKSTDKMNESWKELGFKDRAQYIMAILLIASGIILAFVSFFMIFTIPSGVLIYIAQAFVAGGSIMGVTIYFKNQLAEVRGETTDSIKKMIEEAVKRMDKKGEG